MKVFCLKNWLVFIYWPVWLGGAAQPARNIREALEGVARDNT